MRSKNRLPVGEPESDRALLPDAPPYAAITRLPADSALRNLAERVCSSSDQPISDVQPIIDALSNLSVFRSRDREVAGWLLRHTELDSEARRFCLDALENTVVRNDVNRTRQIGRWFYRTLLISGAVFLTAVLAMPGRYTYSSLLDGISGFIILSGLLVVLFAPITYPLHSALHNRWLGRLRPAVSAIGALRLPESIPVLERAARHRSLRSTAMPALRAALSAVTPDHYGRLGTDAVPALCRLLLKGCPFPEEVYEALASIGDGRAVPTVRRLASRGCPSAARLLPLLMERLKQEQSSAMLLRGSSAALNTPDALLRPASATVDASPEQLLRPTSRSAKGKI